MLENKTSRTLSDALYPLTAPLSAEQGDIISQWRERLLTYILRGAAIAGLLTLIASIISDIQIQDWVDIAITSVAYGLLLIITFVRMPFRLRASGLIFLLYAMVANSLLSSGIRGDARVFCIAFVVMTLMLLGVRAGWIALGVAMFSVIAVALAVVSYNLQLKEPFDQASLSVWISPAFVMLLVSFLLMLGVILLQRAFSTAQQREKKAREELMQDREQLESRVSERTRELSLAADVGRSVSQLHNLDTLLPKAVELIRAQFSLYYAQIYLMDASGKMLSLRAGTGGVGAELLRRGHRLPVGPGSINGVAAAECKTMIVVDTVTNPIFRPNPLLPETRSELAVPLLVGERVVGVLDLQSRHPGALSSENLSVFEALAGQLAIALENAALFAETEKARKEVEEQARRLTQAGWHEFLNALERGERIGYQYNQDTLSSYNHTLPLVPAEGGVKLPILVTGAAVGTIQIERGADQPLQEEELELVSAVAGQASRQLDNLRLLAQAESYRVEAEDAARRLTREGWVEYLHTRSDVNSFVYNQNEVKPLESNGPDGQSDPGQEAAGQPAGVVQPLKVGEETVGELAFDGVEQLDAATHEMVVNVAGLLSNHIEGLRLTEQTQKALIQIEELYDSSAQVVRSKDINNVLKTVIETTGLRRFERGGIVLFDQPWVDEAPVTGIVSGTWEHTGAASPTPLGAANPVRGTPLAQLLHRDELVSIPDVLTDVSINDQHRAMLQMIGRSLVFFPLVASDQWFGFLSVASNQPVHLDEYEIRQIQTLVGQAATIIQSMRLLQNAQTRAQREQALRQITSVVRGSTNADTILRTATRELGMRLGRKVKVQLGGSK